MTEESTAVRPSQLAADDQLGDWRYLLDALHARFATRDLQAGAAFVAEVVSAAAASGQQPAVDLRPDHVTVRLSAARGGVTTREVALARDISAMAASAGHRSQPARLAELEVGIDAMDRPACRKFWAAVLGQATTGADGPTDQLEDPAHRRPTVWFQQLDQPRPQRNRMHLDLSVPHDVAEERVQAAVAAGGLLVTDQFAPSWWVLADPEGNEVCISTWQGRDEDGGHLGQEG